MSIELDEGTFPAEWSCIRHSEKTDLILPAMLAAQKEIAHARKDAENPHFHSSYASLNSYIDACKSIYNEHGIVVVQGVGGDETRVTVATHLAHISGQWYECEMAGKPEKSGPQPMGSVITYFRRYGLAAMAFMGAEDDDGNAGQQAPKLGTKKQEDKLDTEAEAKKTNTKKFNAAWKNAMETVADDDADNLDRLKRHFIKITTEGSDKFLVMTDSIDSMNSGEIAKLTAMLVRGKAKVAGHCAGDWRKELGLPALGVESCEVCNAVLTEAEKASCSIAKIDPHCTKHVAEGLKKAQEAKSEGN